MDDAFPNPETIWHREKTPDADPESVTKRLGPINATLVQLPGGLANEMWRVGNDRVLRIYRRDTQVLQRELILHDRPWEHFRVPRVIENGDDFLLMEYVEHTPLSNSGQHGASVGTALAEIHQQRFDTCGLFGDEIHVVEPWDSFPRTIETYILDGIKAAEQDARLFEQVAEFVAGQSLMMSKACQQPVLLHGDFKASNLHWTEGELLVLDWEFAYAGPPSMDLGQLIRWGNPNPFRDAFATAYTRAGGQLKRNWAQTARVFDVVNLVGLVSNAAEHSQQRCDCRDRLEAVLREEGDLS